MKKQYTRKQITEAIAHWQSVLKKIDESSHCLLSLLADKYGNDIVLSDNRSFNLDNSIAYDLFNILNDNVFNSKIPRTKILCGSYNEIVAELKQRKSDIPSNDFYGLFDTIAHDEHLKQLSDNLKYSSNIILVNTSLMNNSNFVFMCSTLCHEMIHLYDQLYGEKPICDKHWLLYKLKIDSHTTPTFISMKRKANDMGLNVIDTGDGFSFSDLNSEAYLNLMNSIVNDGVNLNEQDEFYDKDKTILTKKIPGIGTNICHVDHI